MFKKHQQAHCLYIFIKFCHFHKTYFNFMYSIELGLSISLSIETNNWSNYLKCNMKMMLNQAMMRLLSPK